MTNLKNQLNLLVVDDQDEIRATLKRLLGKHGYQVVVARNGKEAVEAVAQQRFDLILMDIRMPGMSGVDAFIQIKQASPKTPVILMTAYAMEEDIRRAISEGAHTVVYKPFDMEKVLGLIGECLDDKNLVLVVDDNANDRKVIRSILENKGCRVVEAKNAKEGIQKVVERRFEIVILDVELSGIGSLETLKQIKRIRPDTCVIMMTPESFQEKMNISGQYGPLAYLKKPVAVKDLLSVLEHSLEKNQKPS